MRWLQVKNLMRSQYCFNWLGFLGNKSNKIIPAYLHVGGVKLEIVLCKTSQFFARHWQLIIPYGHACVNDWEVPLRFKGVKQRSGGKEIFLTLPHESPPYFGFLFTKQKQTKQNKKKKPTKTLNNTPQVSFSSRLSTHRAPLVQWLTRHLSFGSG